jgi:hypothetical protein
MIFSLGRSKRQAFKTFKGKEVRLKRATRL